MIALGALSPRRWLAGITVLGALLRLYAIRFGLPYMRARPDEIDAVMHGQMVMRGDFNPHFFHWPSLTFYTFGAVFTTVSDVLGALTPGVLVSDARYLVVARIVVALAGTATLAVLYDLARRIADAWTGVAAALLLAVAVLHVRESHFAMTDVLMTLLVTASLALLVRAQAEAEADPGSDADPLRWFAVSGLVGGLAASTKYNAAAVVAAMAAVQLVLLVRPGARAATPAVWAATPIFVAAFVCGFLLGTPYAAIDSRTFMADLRFDFAHLSAGHGHDLGLGWSYHLTRSLPYGVGLTTCMAAVAGVIPLTTHYGRRAAAAVCVCRWPRTCRSAAAARCSSGICCRWSRSSACPRPWPSGREDCGSRRGHGCPPVWRRRCCWRSSLDRRSSTASGSMCCWPGRIRA